MIENSKTTSDKHRNVITDQVRYTKIYTTKSLPQLVSRIAISGFPQAAVKNSSHTNETKGS